MGLSARVGRVRREIGTPDFWFSFFSTIGGHLEPDGWGTQYPIVMDALFHGKVESANAAQLEEELIRIRARLAAYPPGDVIWDIDDRSKRPPWGTDISPDITNLSNYFVTSDGKDLFDVLLEMARLLQKGGVLAIE
jgi:hypothetical protein